MMVIDSRMNFLGSGDYGWIFRESYRVFSGLCLRDCSHDVHLGILPVDPLMRG